MASDDAGQTHTSEFPESVTRWLDETADELGLSRQQLLSELLTAQRAIDEDDAVAGELDALRDEFMSKLTDLRERVVQVNHETDGKAPADHDHPDLRAQLDELQQATDALDALGRLSDGRGRGYPA